MFADTQAEITYSIFSTGRNKRKPTGANVNASQNESVIVSHQDQEVELDRDSKSQQPRRRVAINRTIG